MADTLLELQQGDERSSQDKASSGNSLTLQLDTDNQSSELETFAITVFGGRDSGKYVFTYVFLAYRYTIHFKPDHFKNRKHIKN